MARAPRLVIAAALLPSIIAAAQPVERWTNPPLKERTTGEQYDMIFRGHEQECTAKAIQVSRSTIQPVRIPENPFWEAAENSRLDRERQAMARDLFYGCLAEKGWVRER